MPNNKTILITGVAGLIGSRMAQWIIQHYPEHNVIGLDDLSGGYIDHVHPEVNFVKINILNPEKLEACFKKYQPDYVYHFAAYAAEGLSPFIRSYNYKNNLIATAYIINNCINYDVTRLIYTSSMAVYGHGENSVFDENLQPAPIDPYGVAKFACEMDIKIAGEQHDLDWCIIRPHNVYGVHQNIWDKYRNVIGIWMYQYLNGSKMTIFGDGEQKRAFSYVDDCLKPFWNAAVKKEASREIINLGGIKAETIKNVNRTLRDILGDGKVVHLEPRHEVKHAVPTYRKSVELLGFAHQTDLRNGIKKMWEWARKQPIRDRKKWENFEIDKKLYSYWTEN